jgi:hypothetical protein
MSTPDNGNSLAEKEEQQRAAVRAKHQVKLVEDKNEGFSLHKQPEGTYGFTYSPTAEDIPVFGKRPYQAFEVHKLANGEYIIGFLTPEAFAQVNASTGNQVSVQLYPESWQSATEFVVIHFDRIAKSKRQPSRDEGNFVKIEVEA